MQCEVIGSLFDVMDRIARKEKVPKELGAPGPLYRADLQFIDIVAAHPGQSATVLAEALGVTRGAVTQWGNRLEALGMIRRMPVEGNRKTKRIFLTALGEAVRAERARLHHQDNARMCEFLRTLRPGQLDAILRFLELAAALDISPFECMACCCAVEGSRDDDA